MFWADQLANEVLKRSKSPVIRSGQTPSGGKHIGNLNDVVRAHFVYKSIIEKGAKARFIHTTDDRDPLKAVPRRLADLDARWHESSQFNLQKYIGMPLVSIPDPFGCCSSYAEHFTKLWMTGLDIIGTKPELHSNDALYKAGKFDRYIIDLFTRIDEAGKIIARFQGSKSESYIPFDAICSNCGRLANIDSFSIENRTVRFTCGGKAIKNRMSEGCGFSGDVPWSSGKLQWRFEWPAQWGIFNTDFEPFGKDHSEGSWKSGQVIAREIYGIEPPIPYVYEFFLVNNEKMSASEGNVYIVQDMMKIMEKEVFMYFYTKRPGKQRNLDLRNIHLLVDDFESAERIYFDKKDDERNVIRSYEMAMSSIPSKKPVRIPYQFAALISQFGGGLNRAIELMKFTGHVSDPAPDELDAIYRRLEVARYWALNYAPDNMRIDMNEKAPAIVLTANERKALADLISEIEKAPDEKALQSSIYDTARSNSMEPKDLFRLVYRLLLNRDSGPRLGPFMIAAGKERVLGLLSSVKK